MHIFLYEICYGGVFMYNGQIKKGGLPAQRKGFSPSSRTRSADDSPLIKTVLISSLLGIGIAAVAGILLLFIVCFIATSSEDPLSLITPLSLIALLPSNFLGGFVSSKRTGESPLACGIVTAAIWGIISLVLSLCLVGVQSSSYALWQSLLLHAISALFCVLGAFAGCYKPQIKKKRRFGR